MNKQNGNGGTNREPTVVAAGRGLGAGGWGLGERGGGIKRYKSVVAKQSRDVKDSVGDIVGNLPASFKDSCDPIKAHLDNPGQSFHLKILPHIIKVPFATQGHIHRCQSLGPGYLRGSLFSPLPPVFRARDERHSPWVRCKPVWFCLGLNWLR